MNIIANLLLSTLIVSQPINYVSTNKPNSTRMQPNQNVVNPQSGLVIQSFLSAVQQGNFEKAASLISPTVVWNQPGVHRFAGLKNSQEALLQMIGGMVSYTAQSLRLTRFTTLAINDQQGACVVHWQGVEEAGGRLDVDNIDMYTVTNGKITAATIYSTDIEQENRFWGH